MSQAGFFVVFGSVAGVALGMGAPVFADFAPVTWDQFVAQCENPKGSGDKQKQFEPEDIKIECTVVSREYLEDKPGVYDLPAARTVTAAIVSNKLAVEGVPVQREVLARTGECIRYMEVEKVTRFTQPVNCETILQIAHGKPGKGGKKDGKKDGQDENRHGKGGNSDSPGTPADFCEESARHKGGKDKIVEVKETGVSRNSCPADARYPGKGGKKDDPSYL